MKRKFGLGLVLVFLAIGSLAYALRQSYRVTISENAFVDVTASSRGEALAIIRGCGVKAALWNVSANTLLIAPAENPRVARQCVADRQSERYFRALPHVLLAGWRS